MSSRLRVAIVGAGVSGLTCAVVLKQAKHDVTVFYSDRHAAASPVAAAIWYPYHIQDRKRRVQEWGLESYREFKRLARVPRTGVSMVWFDVGREVERSLPRWALSMPYRLKPRSGFAIKVPLIETPAYLPWLRQQLRGRIHHRPIRKLAVLEREFDVVVNCSGLGAKTLCRDLRFEQSRGIVLKTPKRGISRHLVTKKGGLLTYILSREKDIILGGTDDERRGRNAPQRVTQAILERCSEVEPRLPTEFTPVVGFRPTRKPVRVALERGTRIVHNYGHGGAGFTVSWGCAREVLRLVQSVRNPG